LDSLLYYTLRTSWFSTGKAHSSRVIFTKELRTWLFLSREIASGEVERNSISRVTSNRYLICFALAVAVAIGIARFVCGSQRNRTTLALEETYATISLVVTVLMGVQVVFQVNAERAALSKLSSRDRRSR